MGDMNISIRKLGSPLDKGLYRLLDDGYAYTCDSQGRVICVSTPAMKLNTKTGKWERL